MARKKRTIEESVAPTTETKEVTAYQDTFQQNVNQKLEDVSKNFEGKGKTILYGIAALAVLAVLVGIFLTWNRRSDATAQTALGKAIETSEAVVSESPMPAGSTVKSFKSNKDRAQAAITEFEAVAAKFGGNTAEKAKYFIAVNRLTLDRAAGITELESLSKSSDEVGKLAKFALAQTKASDAKYDEAVALYKELAALDNPIIAKDTLNSEIAAIYVKQGKKQEAADLYFAIAKAASEAKDLDGKNIPLTSTAREAKEKLTELNPEKAKEIPEATPDASALGGLPFGQ